MEFIEIRWQSDCYHEELKLRDELLRAPLGLSFSAEDVRTESSELHFGIVDQQRLIACAVIVLLSDAEAKLRQMVVAETRQRGGVGSNLIRNIERALVGRHFKTIELHARENAVEFYEKLGYRKVGESFLEVNLPHWKMAKSIHRSGRVSEKD